MENGNIGKEQENLSELIIKFVAPGAVFFNVESNGTVYPGQMIVIGEYLKDKGKELIKYAELMQQQEHEKQKIAIAKPTLVRK